MTLISVPKSVYKKMQAEVLKQEKAASAASTKLEQLRLQLAAMTTAETPPGGSSNSN